MAIPHAASGELIDLLAADGASAENGSVTLVRDEHFEIFRLAMPAGKELPEHRVPSLITIQCLRGSVEVKAHGRSRAVPAGFMMYLSSSEPHTVRALEDSTILVTMRVNRE